MKTISSIIYILFFGLITCYGQDTSMDFSKFRLNGLEYYASKQAIENKHGKPNKVVKADYECGFYSEREQGSKYYHLDYGQVKFIGNEKEMYAIETIKFSPKGGKTLEYGQWKLSGQTTTKDFANIFGTSALIKPYKHSSGETSYTLYGKDADNGLTFYFNAGKLIRIEHYSPC